MTNYQTDYRFFFVGGSCGSFVKTIFFYYLRKLGHYHRLVKLAVNPITGDCHGTLTESHCHNISTLDHDKKIVLIDFDDNDRPVMSKMAFNKVAKAQILNDVTVLKTNWGINWPQLDNINWTVLEQFFVDNPDYLISSTWKDQIKNINPVLTVRFKDVMSGDLNNTIANYHQTTPLVEIDKFIEDYRNVNQQYFV